MKKIIPFAMIILAMSSCNKYYKATLADTGENSAQRIESLKNAGRYFILRNGNQAFAMNSVVVNKDEKTMQCMLAFLPQEHQLHLEKGINGKMRYGKSESDTLDKYPVLNEVHFYILNNTNVQAGPYTLPLNQVQKIEIIEKDKIRTRKSRTTGVILTVVGSALVLTIITAVAYGAFLGALL